MPSHQKHNDRIFNQSFGIHFSRLRQRTQISRKELAKVLGISMQQLQKYETGQNRFPLSKLLVAMRYLSIPVELLLEPFDKLQIRTPIVTFHHDDYVSFMALAKGIMQLSEHAKKVADLHPHNPPKRIRPRRNTTEDPAKMQGLL